MRNLIKCVGFSVIFCGSVLAECPTVEQVSKSIKMLIAGYNRAPTTYDIKKNFGTILKNQAGGEVSFPYIGNDLMSAVQKNVEFNHTPVVATAPNNVCAVLFPDTSAFLDYKFLVSFVFVPKK